MLLYLMFVQLGAVSFIENVTADNLRMSQEEFNRSVCEVCVCEV